MLASLLRERRWLVAVDSFLIRYTHKDYMLQVQEKQHGSTAGAGNTAAAESARIARSNLDA
jgi:hypothetical protein